MARYCDNDCYAVCDFCKNYKDDGKDTGTFEGEGICLATGKRVDAGGKCEENFVCFTLED